VKVSISTFSAVARYDPLFFNQSSQLDQIVYCIKFRLDCSTNSSQDKFAHCLAEVVRCFHSLQMLGP